jgi:hypothetical protein
MTEPPPPVPIPIRPPPRHNVPMVIILSAAIGLALWFLFGYHPASPRYWALPNGDTVEIITEQDERSYMVNDSPTASRYAWIQFRSPLRDTARDRRDVEAIVELVCGKADSLGFRHIKVEPTKTTGFGLIKFSLGTRWFAIDSAPRCTQGRPR